MLLCAARSLASLLEWDILMVEHEMAVRQEQLARDEASAYFAAYVRGRQGPLRGQLPI